MKILRTSHKFTDYELTIIRFALYKLGDSKVDQDSRITAKLLFNRLKKEQIEQKRQNDKEND